MVCLTIWGASETSSQVVYMILPTSETLIASLTRNFLLDHSQLSSAPARFTKKVHNVCEF